MNEIQSQLSSHVMTSEFDLGQFARAVALRWPFIVIFPVLSLFAAHFLIPFLPVQYRASAQLLIYDPLRASTASVARNTSSPRELDPVAINTEVEVIRSASALRRLARELKLDQVPEFNDPGLTARLREVLGWHELELESAISSRARGEDDAGLARATAALAKHITVERQPLSYVVTVSAAAGQPELAYRLVTDLLDGYIDGQEELSRRSLGQSAAWVRTKVAELQGRLNGTRTEIERLRVGNGVSQDGKATLVQQQRADLNAKLVAVRAEITERQSHLDLGRESLHGEAAENSEGMTSPTLSQLRVQLSLLSRQIAQLSSRFGPQHAQVLALNDQASTLRRAISDEVSRALAEEQANLEIAQRREQALVAELGRLGKEQADAGVLSRLQDLQQAADADAKLLETYSARLEEVETAEELGMGGKRILSPASVPGAPNSPRKPLIYAGGGVLGVLLGCAFAAIRAYFDMSIPPTGPGQRRFGFPVFGNVPMLKKPQNWRTACNVDSLAMAHAMRSVHIGLQLHGGRGTPQVVLVTSAIKAEGCSTVAAALAAVSKRSGLSTVLVDCDPAARSGRLSPNWSHSGLAEALSTEVDAASLTRRDPVSGYHVLGAGGSYSPQSHPFLRSERFPLVVRRLRDVFDIIIIDAPPLLPIPQAAAMAQSADAVLLVVDAPRAKTAHVTQALSTLGEKTGRSIGIVLNKQPLAQLRRTGLTQSAQETKALLKEARRARWDSAPQKKKIKATVAAERTSP